MERLPKSLKNTHDMERLPKSKQKNTRDIERLPKSKQKNTQNIERLPKSKVKYIHNIQHSWESRSQSGDRPGEPPAAGAGRAGHKVLQEGPLVGLPAEGEVTLQGLHDGGGVRQREALAQQLRVRLKHHLGPFLDDVQVLLHLLHGHCKTGIHFSHQLGVSFSEVCAAGRSEPSKHQLCR